MNTIDNHYVKKFNRTKESLEEFVKSISQEDKGIRYWILPNGTDTTDPNRLLWEIKLDDLIEWEKNNHALQKDIENTTKTNNPTSTPQQSLERVVVWRDKVIPLVQKLVEAECEKEGKNGAEVPPSTKLEMYERYLELATQVYCS